MKAEVELEAEDGKPPSAGRLLGDLKEALSLLGAVETAAYDNPPMRVLVLDDDERLGELTARGLRRLGFDAEARTALRALRPHEVVVLDLGLVASFNASDLAVLKRSRPVVVTGASDAASRGLAASLDASDYLLKPAEPEQLAAAITARASREAG
jgi:DNA-binding response OmpR family regulator